MHQKIHHWRDVVDPQTDREAGQMATTNDNVPTRVATLRPTLNQATVLHKAYYLVGRIAVLLSTDHANVSLDHEGTPHQARESRLQAMQARSDPTANEDLDPQTKKALVDDRNGVLPSCQVFSCRIANVVILAMVESLPYETINAHRGELSPFANTRPKAQSILRR